jgi:hypothetical protein
MPGVRACDSGGAYRTALSRPGIQRRFTWKDVVRAIELLTY